MAVSVVPGPDQHHHRDCGFRDRAWLEREAAAPASAVPHPYCVDCGTVKSLTLPRAKPLGYYLSGLARLKQYLERSAIYGKLAQVHSHLIADALSNRPEFEDPYGTPGQVQVDAYVDIVRSIRPDLNDELILQLLPGTISRRVDNKMSRPSPGS